MRTIVVTGPESTGKTAISEFLSEKLNGQLIPEYARDYIQSIKRPYIYEDLIKIGQTQIHQLEQEEKKSSGIIILDTWLIITKIWFLEVYGVCPEWIEQAIHNKPVDFFLLCKPDIPWIPDPLRENGGKKRIYLFNKYLDEIIKTGIPYAIITGYEEERYNNALNKVNLHFLK